MRIADRDRTGHLWLRIGPFWVSAELAAGALVVLAVVGCAVMGTFGCGSRERYVAARSAWSAVEAVDHLASTQYANLCSHERPSSAELEACRETLRRLDTLIPIGDRYVSLASAVRVMRDSVAAAILAMWAAEEGDAPADLRQRLSCAAASLHVMAMGIEQLQLPLPVVLEQAMAALVSYGGVARDFALGECPGWDGSGRPPRGETPLPPVGPRDAETQAGPTAVDGGTT